MKNFLLSGLSSLLLPLGAYAGPISGASYQRTYLSSTINASSNLLHTHTALPRDLVDLSGDQLDIQIAHPIRELVIVDEGIAESDKSVLRRALKPGVEMVQINSASAGLPQLISALKGHKNLAAIHIISHAEAGVILLGNSRITPENIQNEVQIFTALNGAVREGGDLLFYGCDLAANKAGEDLLDIINNKTGLDVAASNNLTGNSALNGDWDLEIKHGNIESELAFSEKSLKDFSSVLVASNGIKTFQTGWTNNTTNLTSTDFIVTGKDSDTSGINVSIFAGSPFPAYLMSGYDGTTSGTYFHIAADGTNTGSFELTDLVAGEYLTGQFTNVHIVGIKPDNSTITSGVINGTGSTDETFTFGAGQLGSFSGVKLKAFKLVFDTNSASNTKPFFEFRSFTITGALAPNTTPTTSNLNGDSTTWAGVGNTVALDGSANANLADVDLDALNGGSGNWQDATLTVQRSGTAITSDVLGFNTSGALFTVTGTTSGNLQSGGQTFATYTNTNGVLAITFTSSATAATSALVDNVAQRITYRSDTPAGDATISFVLTDGDGGTATTANVTVSSDTIYVTNTSDTSFIDRTNGVSFSEAVAIAAADATGSQTIAFAGSLASTALTINSVSLGESLTLDMDAASGMSLTTGTITLSSGTLSLSNGTGDTATISSVLTNSGALTKIGAGSVTLSATNTYSGATTVSAGTLTLSGGDAISGNSSVTVASGATLVLSTSESVGNLSGAGSVTLGANTLTTTQTADTTFSGGISGTGGLSVNQTGAATFALTLTGTNTYSGTTTLTNFGRLRLDGDASVSSSSQLRVNGNSIVTLLTDQTVGSLFSNNANASIQLGSFTLSAGGDNTSTTVSGVISGTGNLVKQGSGTLTVAGTNTYSGTTTVSAGTLSIASDSNLGSNTVTLAATSTLDVTGATTIDNAIVLSGSATVSNSANANLSGTISGANTLTKAGASTLTLSGSNTYAATSVSAGTLSIASDNNLGSGTVTLGSGVTLAVTGATNIDNSIALSGNASVNNSANATLSGTISGANTLTKTGASTLTLSGSNSYSGTTLSAGTLSLASDNNLGSGSVSLASGTTLAVTGATTIDNSLTLSGDATVNNSAAVTLSGGITGSGNLSKSGASTLTLSGANSAHAGNTTVNAGTLSIGGDNNLGSGNLTLAGGTTLVLSSGGTIDNNLVLGGGATLQVAADTIWSGVISGSNNLVKTGANTLILSNTNTLSGTTTVSAGTLTVTGTASATTVSSGATLTGTGTVDRVIVQSGGTLSPGSSPGTLTINGDLTMASGSTLAIEINSAVAGTGYDQVIVNGAVDVSGATLSPTHSYTAASGDIYIIIPNDAADAVTGAFSGLAEGTTLTAGGNSTELTSSYIGGTGNDFTLTAPVAPTVNSVSSGTANGSYKIGDTLDITVTFDTAVTVDTTGGTPAITLETGASDRTATYVSGSNSATLTFSYTIQAGDVSSDLDYVSTSALVLNGSTIKDGSNDAILTLASPGAANSLGANKALVIDGVIPTAGIVVADTALAAGETSLVTITFSEAVTGLANVDLTIANGALSTVSSSDGGITWTATLTPTASTTNTSNLITLNNTGVADAAGNAGTGTTDSNNYAIDTLRPTASIVVADTVLSVGETSLVTITFNEAVTGFAIIDLTVANGVISGLSSSDGGITWTATLTPTASVADPINVITLNNTGVQDAAGNAGSGNTDSNNYAIDNARPTASLVVTDTNLIAGETSLVTITFSEAVTGFTATDLTVANGVVNGPITSDGGITWTSTLTPTTSVTAATNLITLDNTAIADASGNTGVGTTDSNNYAIDTLQPTASIVVADTALAVGETSVVTITFNEAVTGVATGDFTVENGVLSNLSSGDGGITWTATLTPTSGITDPINVITLDNTGVLDAAGNAGTSTTNSNNYAIDNEGPTASLVVADTTLAAGETSLVTITFSEAITGLATADLTVANGVVSGLSSSDGGITWTATLTPTASITDPLNVITLDNTGVTDAAGNAGTGTTDSNNYSIDSSRPTASIVVTDTVLAAGETSLITMTFSEAVTGFTTADLTVANGAISGLSTSDGGITWTGILTPTASVSDPTNVVTLNNTGVTDAANNAGTGTTSSNNYAIDTLRPTASIVVSTTALIEGETSVVTITFNEAVTGFTNADLTIESASLSAVTSSDGGFTWTATLTAAVGVNDSTNVITLANTGVIDAAGNAGTGTTASNNYTVNMANSAPILSGVNGGSTYVENGMAVVIDADASLSDADFDLLNSANGNYSGASLVIVRSGGVVSSDIISFTNGNGINQIGNSLIKNGLAIANINSSIQGQSTITFTDANTEIPTRADALAVLRQLTYSSSNNDPAASVNLDLVLSDGIEATPGVASVNITSVNDAPTLTATGLSPGFTEGGSAVSLFSAAAVSTVEAGQLITELRLTISNLANSADEILSIDGSNLALTNGNSVTTATNGMTANVSLSGSTATVVVTKSAGISTTAVQALVNSISYRNTSEAVVNSSRAVTLTGVVDNGGTANSGADTATVSIVSTVTVTAVNDGPAMSGTAATSVNQDVAYTFVPSASDVDGNTLVFSILNQPSWASFSSVTGALSGTPTNADVGVTNAIVISVSDGTASVSLPAFNLTVVNVNDAPTISGTPTANVDEDSAYSFTPTANDVDSGTTLVYSITNQPSWASFSTTTGSLSGTPTNADVGVTTGIVISVSDGTVSSSLSGFNLTVSNTNDAPTISGTPATSIDQDATYNFIPTGSDVDLGTTLTYSITNKPAWASFNTVTGALTGTPVYADSGVYPGIVINVSDGQLSAALPAFSITVIQGLNPDEPVLTAPADLTLNATALYTPVSLRQLLGLASNSTQAQVDAALDALASNTSNNNCCTTAPEGLNTNNALLLAPGRHEVRWISSNTDGLTDEEIQIVNIKPLVSFSKSQLAIRNSQIEFRILLNGPSPVYPFEVAYQIDNSTTAGSNEHNLIAGTAQFTVDNPLEVVIPVTINPLTGIGNRELVVTFADSQINAGASNRHTISIREGNLPPIVKLVLRQGGIETSLVTPDGGPVTVMAEISDFNVADTHSFDWSATVGLADTDSNSSNANRIFDPAGLTGVHQALVTVTDSAGASVQADLSFKVVTSLPVLSVNDDTDGDGTNDLDEGADDTDSNGIPDYLDNMPSSNVLPQVGIVTDSYLIECDPGVRCGLGLLALTGNSGGVQILDDEVETLGNLVKDDKFVPAGGIFDFVIRDLPTPGQTVRVVIPQQAAIPANAVYRKFQKGQWVNFVEDAKNSLHSAAGNPGYCPPPGAVDWQPGLTAGHLCVQLGIEDGGPNDDDGLVNAAVSDPGAVSSEIPVVPPVVIQSKGKGGGSLDLWFITVLLGLMLMTKRKPAGLTLVLLAAVASVNTQASAWLDKTYLQLDLYQVNSSMNRNNVQSNLRDQGFDLDVTRFDDSRTAWSMAAGYEWNGLTYSRVGYLDLGDVSLDIRVAGDADMAALESALEDTYPVTASGFTLSQGLQMHFHPALTLSTELGVFIWDAEIEVIEDRVDLSYNNEADLMFGVRLDYQIAPQIIIGLSSQEIRFDHQHVNLLGVSGRFEF